MISLDEPSPGSLASEPFFRPVTSASRSGSGLPKLILVDLIRLSEWTKTVDKKGPSTSEAHPETEITVSCLRNYLVVSEMLFGIHALPLPFRLIIQLPLLGANALATHSTQVTTI